MIKNISALSLKRNILLFHDIEPCFFLIWFKGALTKESTLHRLRRCWGLVWWLSLNVSINFPIRRGGLKDFLGIFFFFDDKQLFFKWSALFVLFFISCVQCICLSMLLKAVLLKCDPRLNITKAVLSCLPPFLFVIRYKYIRKQKVLGTVWIFT